MPRMLPVSLLLLLAAPASAQVERYELGLRLRAFEKDWDLVAPSAEARKRTVAPLQQAMKSFFSFNFSGAAVALDTARHLLKSVEKPAVEARWADSLSVQPATRLADRDQKGLAVIIKLFYKVEGDIPAQATGRLQWGNAKPVAFALNELPKAVTLEEVPAAGDHTLQFEILVAGKRVGLRSVQVSVVVQRDARLAIFKQAADAIESPRTIEQATLKSLTTLLLGLADKAVHETDYPAAELMKEAETVYASVRKETVLYDLNREGQFWLTVPGDKGGVAVRLFVPEKLEAKSAVPLVVALHGMGGSENLFFDGYGDGITRKLCEKNGWMMVAPRAGGTLGFGGPPPVASIIDELRKRYPIDPNRIYVVGHSMGAAHTALVVQQHPERFAGAAALGGGGMLRKPEVVVKVPFFIGCGKADFALNGATALNSALEKVKHERLRLRVYEDVEHLTIVREAIEDVFQFWKGK